jgi:hypothetical protein
MKFKRLIAREWLFFLLFFLISPTVVALYEWASAPKRTTDETSSLYDYFIPDDQIPILRKKLSEQLELTQPKPPDGYQLVPPEKLSDALVIEQSLQTGILTYAKRPLWNYLRDSAMKLDNYLAIIFTYPIFLFLRSILWAIRTVRRKDS